jgi:hypothetical protein
MSTYSTGQRVKLTKGVQRTTGAGWPGDTAVVTEVDSPFIGPDTYTLRKSDGTILKGVSEDHLDRG